MSYQCINEMVEWEEETDKLLTYIPIVGTAFKKTYFSGNLQRNLSEFKKASDVVINYFAKSITASVIPMAAMTRRMMIDARCGCSIWWCPR